MNSSLRMTSTLIVPQRGMCRLTVRCLRTFRTHHGTATPVIVVDDGSDPGELAMISGARLENTAVITRSAEGVTAAWNAGARAADSQILVFLNNDTWTSGPWLERLALPLNEERAWIAGVESRVENALPEKTLRKLPTTRFAAGWCFAVRRRDFEAACGLEPELKTYFSDTDLQARLLMRNSAGPRGIAIAGSEGLAHQGHATAERMSSRREQWSQDRQTFLRLWARQPTDRCGRRDFEDGIPSA